MRKRKPKIMERISLKDRENLVGAIKGNKYWDVSKEDKKYAYVVALTRARERSPIGFYAKATGFGKVQVIKDAAKYCRKYRILVLDSKELVAYSVFTWTAFTLAVKKYSKQIRKLLEENKLPCYVNIKILKKLMREKENEFYSKE